MLSLVEAISTRRRPAVWQDSTLRAAQQLFDLHFDTHPPLRRVLDAGAGDTLPLHIPAEARLVAIDVSPQMLERNRNADEKILADIQTWEAPEPFDAAICWWVLEHLRRPEQAMERLAASVRTGGLVLIGVPYLWGFKAIATKATPHRFHVWFARRTNPAAGKDGNAPFPTFLRYGISPRALRQTARRNSLSLVWETTHSLNPEDQLPRSLRVIWQTVGLAVKTVTLGRYDPLLSEYAALFTKI